MMDIIGCLLLGYLIGTLNPASLISWIKNIDLREHGTGNLGATNTMLAMGKGYGALVLAIDLIKAVVAAQLAEALFSHPRADIIASGATVYGHVFPFYMHFKGGKGLAAYGGMVLVFDPFIFAVLLIIGVILMFVINYAVMLPISAAALFPIFAALRTRDTTVIIVALLTSSLVLVKHIENIKMILHGDDVTLREYLKKRRSK